MFLCFCCEFVCLSIIIIFCVLEVRRNGEKGDRDQPDSGNLMFR